MRLRPQDHPSVWDSQTASSNGSVGTVNEGIAWLDSAEASALASGDDAPFVPRPLANSDLSASFTPAVWDRAEDERDVMFVHASPIVIASVPVTNSASSSLPIVTPPDCTMLLDFDSTLETKVPKSKNMMEMADITAMNSYETEISREGAPPELECIDLLDLKAPPVGGTSADQAQ